MLESANDARKRANHAAGALRIVNEAAGAPLIVAVQLGQTSVLIEIEPAELPVSVGSVGRVRRELAPGVVDRLLMHQLGEALRQRGFRVDPLDGGNTLRLK